MRQFDEWMRSGRLSSYVTERKSGGEGIKLFECAQPAGDKSDRGSNCLVLVQLRSDHIPQRSNFGAGRREFVALAGQFSLVPPGFASEIEVFAPQRIRIASLEADHFRPILEEARPGGDPFDFGVLHDGAFTAPQLGAVMERMWADAADRGGGRLLAEGAALQLLALLARGAAREMVQVRGGLAPWAERRVRDYLHTHYARDTSLSELAALVGLSPFHFTRMFKQSTGVAPYAYLRALRVEQAQALLAASDLPVTEVAARVGYDTPQAFARMFRAEVGTSPSRWRRLNGGGGGEGA
ncbi:AraC family transcriptional regulator [Erythrobacter colymbi]|uniref:AraC family transcriptional regulator n=1 Tax=Erythrobacter colymbi TaxID=1161202 RepID=UPI000A38396C|nr:AraC family transcriptional regulator [Erythrobacter colymbi]